MRTGDISGSNVKVTGGVKHIPSSDQSEATMPRTDARSRWDTMQMLISGDGQPLNSLWPPLSHATPAKVTLSYTYHVNQIFQQIPETSEPQMVWILYVVILFFFT